MRVSLQTTSCQSVDSSTRWVSHHKDRTHPSDLITSLEFALHRYEFLRILLSSTTSDAQKSAIVYLRENLSDFIDRHPEYQPEAMRLSTCMIYLPLERLRCSPYADFVSPAIHEDLIPLFTKAFSTNLNMSKEAPLRVVADIGGGGALAKIEKGRKIMRERKSEWSQTNELPVIKFSYSFPNRIFDPLLI